MSEPLGLMQACRMLRDGALDADDYLRDCAQPRGGDGALAARLRLPRPRRPARGPRPTGRWPGYPWG